jgi:diguanylate cyclase (GGDEF)-like protein
MGEIVELGLTRPESGTGKSDEQTGLRGAIDRLLATLGSSAGTALEAEPEVVSSFVSRLDTCRRELRAASSGADGAAAVDRAIRSIESFLRSSRRYVSARESELKDMIRILHEAARLMAGQSTMFSEQVLASSERLQGYTRLEDIRDLKQHLAAEVTTLRHAVQEKRRLDAESSALLSERLEVLQTQLVKAEEEASIDPLTKIANRGAFDQEFARMIDHARMTKQPLSLALIDIDRFKAINDTHGHPIGDRVLLCAAMWLGRTLRQTDFVARYGGEEFAVLFRDTKLADVEARLTQVLGDIATRSFEYEQDGETRTVRFTASAGAAEWHQGETSHDLVRRADDALYDAKRTGRNKVVAKKRSRLGALLR